MNFRDKSLDSPADICKVHYWRKGEHIQNFGDFLSEYFLERLFLPAQRNVRGIHLVGSVLDDMFVPSRDEGSGPVVFWGCGLRKPDGLSPERQNRAHILAVRGPLSRSHLRLGAQVPIGDPGFLLPALYQPKPAPIFRGRSLCIPHFLETRDDDALLASSGCDLVLRPGISPTIEGLEAFVDAIAAADFVLSASLHGVVVAAAYGQPFAFWNPGTIDVPFKWEDLAASMGVDGAFQAERESGERWYQQAKAAIKLPEAWRLLLNAPLPLRPQAVAQTLDYYAGGRGGHVVPLSSIAVEFGSQGSHAVRMAAEMAEAIRNANFIYREHAALEQALAEERAIARDLQEKRVALEQTLSEAGGAQAEQAALLEQLEHALAEERATVRALEEKRVAQERALTEAEKRRTEQVTQLQQKVADRGDEAQSLHQALSALRHEFSEAAAASTAEMGVLRDHGHTAGLQLQEREARLSVLSGELAAIHGSTSWRATGVLRRFAVRHPASARALRRTAKLVWWTGTGKLRERLKQRSAMIAEAQALTPSAPPASQINSAPVVQNEVHHAPDTNLEPSRTSEIVASPFRFTMAGQPKVLFIDSRYPRVDRDSGSVDTFNMIHILQSFGYEVVFIGLAEFHEINIYGEALQDSGVNVVTSQQFDSTQSFLKQHGKDLALAVLSRVDCGGCFIDDMRRLAPRARVIFNTVDLHHIRQEREAILKNDRLLLNEAHRVEERERYLIRMADATFVVSSFDEGRCRELVPGADVTLLPILRKIPGRQAGFQERIGVGFIGGFEHKPNLDAVDYFLKEIWPRLHARIPELTFHVIGADMPPSLKELSVSGVEMVGFVPELDPWLNRLRLTVAPLRYGAGAKGKVVSSFSFGVPCVMSAIAAEGMGIEGETAELLGRDPEAYVEIIARLYKNADEWLRLSDACLAVVEGQNSLEHGRRIFAKVLSRLDLPTELAKEVA